MSICFARALGTGRFGWCSWELLVPRAWLAKLVGARDPLMHYWASLFPWVDFYRVIAGRMIWSVTRRLLSVTRMTSSVCTTRMIGCAMG